MGKQRNPEEFDQQRFHYYFLIVLLIKID